MNNYKTICRYTVMNNKDDYIPNILISLIIMTFTYCINFEFYHFKALSFLKTNISEEMHHKANIILSTFYDFFCFRVMRKYIGVYVVNGSKYWKMSVEIHLYGKWDFHELLWHLKCSLPWMIKWYINYIELIIFIVCFY